MEYLTAVARDDELQQLFNDYAWEGWELVGVSPHTWEVKELHAGLYQGGHADVRTYLVVMKRERRS